MTPRKKHVHTLESARARVGQLFAAYGWTKDQRREWLNEHMQLSPEQLFRAAEAALGVDHTVWRELSRNR